MQRLESTFSAWNWQMLVTVQTIKHIYLRSRSEKASDVRHIGRPRDKDQAVLAVGFPAENIRIVIAVFSVREGHIETAFRAS